MKWFKSPFLLDRSQPPEWENNNNKIPFTWLAAVLLLVLVMWEVWK